MRRPTWLGHIAEVAGVPTEQVVAVVELFRHPDLNFLAPPPPTPVGPDSLLDITHESLLRQWGRLQEWMRQEEESAAVYQRLKQTALLWKSGRAELWTGIDLDFALKWNQQERPSFAWAERYGGGFDLAIRFVEESLEASRARSVEARSQALRSKLVRAGALTLWLLVTLGLLSWLWYEQHRALIAEARASAAERTLRRATGAAPDDVRPATDRLSSEKHIKSPR